MFHIFKREAPLNRIGLAVSLILLFSGHAEAHCTSSPLFVFGVYLGCKISYDDPPPEVFFDPQLSHDNCLRSCDPFFMLQKLHLVYEAVLVNNELTANCNELETSSALAANDNSLIADGMCIVPNEPSPYLYAKEISQYGQKGTLVSVGTFRSLIDASMGDFDRVILLDFDKVTSAFNSLHLKILKGIDALHLPTQEKRYQYLALLHGT